MPFSIALSIFGVASTSLLLGLWVGFIRESGPIEKAAESDGETHPRSRVSIVPIGLLVALVGCSLRLIDPAAISPLWLQYLLLAAVPAVFGFGATRLLVVLVARTNRNPDNTDSTE